MRYIRRRGGGIGDGTNRLRVEHHRKHSKVENSQISAAQARGGIPRDRLGIGVGAIGKKLNDGSIGCL